MNNTPAIDPVKLALINEFQRMAQGKSTKELLPLVLAISKKASSMNIQFTKDETKVIVDTLAADMAPEQKQQLYSVMNMLL